MLIIKRGDIWVVDFDPTEGREQRGHRPAVVVSSDAMDTNLIGLTYVVPATTSNRRVPNHICVEPTSANGLDQTTYFMGEQMRVASIRRFKRRIGKLSDKHLVQIEQILTFLLDLGPK